MSVIRSPYQAASREMVDKLIRAGYLPPALGHDADAITAAIAQMKQDLRASEGDDDGPEPHELPLRLDLPTSGSAGQKRYAGYPGLAWASVDPAYRSLHRAVAHKVKGILARMSVLIHEPADDGQSIIQTIGTCGCSTPAAQP